MNLYNTLHFKNTFIYVISCNLHVTGLIIIINNKDTNFTWRYNGLLWKKCFEMLKVGESLEAEVWIPTTEKGEHLDLGHETRERAKRGVTRGKRRKTTEREGLGLGEAKSL